MVLSRELEAFEAAGLACFCREKDAATETRAMLDARVDDSDGSTGRDVLCGELPFPGGAEYECGVALTVSKKVLR